MTNDMNSSGIYEIRNLVNNKVYIGSAYNFKKRWATHISTLKSGTHDNQHLQLSVQKYGLDNFQFSIIELCNKEELEVREQHHIDHNFGSNCYNMNQRVECRYMNDRFIKEYNLISPYDELVTVYGTIVDVCTLVSQSIHNVAFATLQRMIGEVFSEKRLHYKGWRLVHNKDFNWRELKSPKKYNGKTISVSLTSPTGEVYNAITNLSEFARIHGLPDSALHSVIGKHTKYYKGWHLTGNTIYEKNSKAYDCILQSPDGTLYNGVTNVTRFAREHELSQSGLRNFILGKTKTYKNWKLIKEPTNE